tara:strand:+ start:214480 stop:215562 length:1083 start_codon:yes stop_codon:yes gene_type:complete
MEGSVKGSFAEIGAGQGISAKFFEAKRASETVVKTISAYGKEESDRLYGGGVRYVSEQRLDQMLEKEFTTILEHKSEYKRGVKVFSIANTVTSNVDGSGHGWLGIKFADLGNPRGAFQEIKIHLNFGKTSLEQQHSELGKLGVNLIHYLFSGQKIPAGDDLIESLLDGVKKKTISLDSIEWSKGMRKVGIPTVDLVDKKFADFVIFDPTGKSLTGKDLFFRKNVLAFEDGSYNPSSSQYLNLRMVNWPELLAKFDGNKKRAISHLRSKLRKGDHVVLTGKNGRKGFQEYLSSTMNSSNTVVLSPDELVSKTPTLLKKHLAKMREKKLLPAIKQNDLDSFSESHYRVLKDLEARGEVIILP